MATEPQPHRECTRLFDGMFAYFLGGQRSSGWHRADSLARRGITVLALEEPQRLVFWSGPEDPNQKFTLSRFANQSTGFAQLVLEHRGQSLDIDRDFLTWTQLLEHVFRIARIPHINIKVTRMRA
jgi:hypothetical protein